MSTPQRASFVEPLESIIATTSSSSSANQLHEEVAKKTRAMSPTTSGLRKIVVTTFTPGTSPTDSDPRFGVHSTFTAHIHAEYERILAEIKEEAEAKAQEETRKTKTQVEEETTTA